MFIFNLLTYVSKMLKFAFGGMVLENVMQAIEEATMNDTMQLQQGFTAFDECSSLSILYFK
jgi:hypothetical protein